jgi:ABC-type phosphate transport system substrate-binding protein
LFFFSLASLMSIPLGTAQAGDVAVIVNPESSVTNISSTDLRKILAGQKRSWPGGIPVKIIVRPPGCHERLVLLRLLGMSEGGYKQYWTAQVLRGEADAEPFAAPSFGMLKEAVTTFPGAIGLVDAQSVRPGMNLKVIKVDQLMPGDAGYPIR